MSLRIALLNAAHDGEDNRRNFRRELDADLVEFDVTERELPESFAFDACLVTGSRASVYWDEPWIADLESWVDDAIDEGVPFLGVCFGHQLLAHTLGGTVAPMDDYEIGYRTVEHDGANPLLSGVDEEFTVFTTHSDHVAELPPGATQFAENDYGVHGFRKGDVFAVQFHPEYDPATAEDVASGKDLPDERIERVLDGITDENYRAACEAKRLFDNFTDYVRGQRVAATESEQVASDD
ncbi:type 1 glutamine amidotransferase [Haloarcula salinisoli]|uniref:Type 1 glutamine amidotransferase n=1 Tax=Haloarcula salinisoli TaxID=2487746 RepID=A0A8J7YD35_9EURY|nr:type 1 glutamine amidotransferase [Halomicroarcula salinisoli]MBX0286505.1 type 1 glutamine amidotransferase [Halomicroarcula salinisoli]MBX0303855.1 type 1 glutamine amidotransferase [Halomicroarcula salinisoli]